MTKDNIIDLSKKKKKKQKDELSEEDKVLLYLLNLKAYEVPSYVCPFWDLKKTFFTYGELIITSDIVHQHHPYDFNKQRIVIKADLYEYNKEEENFFKVDFKNFYSTPIIFSYKKFILDLKTQEKKVINYITEEIFQVLPDYKEYLPSRSLWKTFKKFMKGKENG